MDIAAAVGLDVSSVNKILNRRRGPKFKEATVKAVFAAARKMRYDFAKPSKGALVEFMRAVLPEELSDESLADLRNLPIEQVRRFRAILKRAEGA